MTMAMKAHCCYGRALIRAHQPLGFGLMLPSVRFALAPFQLN